MTSTLWLPGPFPGMNEIIKAAKGGHGKSNGYSRMKREWTQYVALRSIAGAIPHYARAQFSFQWLEKDKRRDKDNVACAVKFIFDGLVQAGVLDNDSWKEIAAWQNSFTVSPTPGVLVTIASEPLPAAPVV